MQTYTQFLCEWQVEAIKAQRQLDASCLLFALEVLEAKRRGDFVLIGTYTVKLKNAKKKRAELEATIQHIEGVGL